ncbi:hypothetical protein ACCAA_460018 [Candidatus Accumulibacter aalborgensis]|uniref:Uncharacterized protein n=1 Tax=Candidatus Accumulibacter aalborgensis TaxID=1860102 RepID=A0A1A8XSW6_9PROT|nr:hypothetical protein ACCAA_460018 [Candidatus Accumulibacter aalborgensis]
MQYFQSDQSMVAGIPTPPVLPPSDFRCPEGDKGTGYQKLHSCDVNSAGAAARPAFLVARSP